MRSLRAGVVKAGKEEVLMEAGGSDRIQERAGREVEEAIGIVRATSCEEV